MPRYIYDDCNTLPANRNVYTKLVDAYAVTGERWARLGGNLSAPYTDRVNKMDGGIKAVWDFIYNGGSYTLQPDYPPGSNPGIAYQFAHPNNESLYYLDSALESYDLDLLTIGYFKYWNGLTYAANTPGDHSIVFHLQGNGNYYFASARIINGNFTVELGKCINGIKSTIASQVITQNSNPSGSASGGIVIPHTVDFKLLVKVRGVRKQVYLYTKQGLSTLFNYVPPIPDMQEADGTPTLILDYVESSSAIPTIGKIGFRFNQIGLDSTLQSTIKNWYDPLITYFSCTVAPLGFATSGFQSGTVQDNPFGVISNGANAEGGLRPYIYEWYRVSGSNSIQFPGQATSALFDNTVNIGYSYTYTQRIVDRTGKRLTAGSFSLYLSSPSTPPPPGNTIPVVTPRPRQTVGARGKLISAPLGSDGIQSFYTGFTANNQIAGYSDILRHTDGNLYMIFAANPTNTSTERNLYFTKSTNNGVTWSIPTIITSGYIDDLPSIVQLTDSVDSNIGFAFNRKFTYYSTSSFTENPAIYRGTVNTLGVQIGGIDPVSYSLSKENAVCISLIRRVDGYLIGFCAMDDVAMSFYFNTSFTTNNWTVTITDSEIFKSGMPHVTTVGVRPRLSSFRLRALSNGHIACVASLTYYSNTFTTNQLSGWARYEVFTTFSDDLGATWSTPQRVTPYTNNCELTFDETPSALDPDIVELSDGTLGVFYAESNTAKYLNFSSSPNVNFFGNQILGIDFNAAKNMLFIALKGNYTGEGKGLVTIDLDTYTVVRFANDTVIPIWIGDTNCVKTSPNGNYVALGTTQSLEIFDSSNSSRASWTVTSLRTSTIPALRNGNITSVYWKSNTRLLAFYGSSSGSSGRVGVEIDLTKNPLDTGYLTDIISTSGATHAYANTNVVKRGNFYLYLDASGNINALADNSGYTSAHLPLGSLRNGSIHFDEINDEYVVVNNETTLKRFTARPTGNTINLITTGTVVGDAAVNNFTNGLAIPGKGIISVIGGYAGRSYATYYSLYEQQTYGILKTAGDFALDTKLVYDFGSGALPLAYITDDEKWALFANNFNFVGTGIVFYPLDKKGYLKYAFFDYNSATKQVTIPSVLTYTPLANFAKIGDDVKYFIHPSVVVGQADALYMCGTYWRPNATLGNFKVFFSKVEPDAFRLQVKTRIIKSTDRSITVKNRTKRIETSSIGVKTAIVFAQCIKVKAKITPRQNKSITIKVVLQGKKRDTIRGSFLISESRSGTVRGVFYVNRGYNRASSIGVGASIIAVKQTTLRGRFLINVPELDESLVAISTNFSPSSFTSIRASIS